MPEFIPINKIEWKLVTMTKSKNRICEVQDCERKHDAKGFCKVHYLKWRKELGNPAKNEITLKELPEIVEKYVDKQPNNGCWLWLGSKNKLGYGQWTRGGRAHRRLYEYLIGKVPEDLYLDHLCRNPSCVNPDHLEPVTPAENQYRSPISLATINLNATHCPRGHEYNFENTYHRSDNKGRKCRKCNSQRWHK